MADKILSSRIEIINYFDDLIKRVDIDIEECLENYEYDQEPALSELLCFEIKNRTVISEQKFNLNSTCSNESDQEVQYETVDQWSESTKVVDYLNQTRNRTIDELKKAQEETLEYYKLNSSLIKSNEWNKMDQLRSELFKEKFYFQVVYKPKNKYYSNPWIFNLYTIVTDFYLSSTEIDLLE